MLRRTFVEANLFGRIRVLGEAKRETVRQSIVQLTTLALGLIQADPGREQTEVNRTRPSVAHRTRLHSFPLIGDRPWPPCLSPSSTFSSYSVVSSFSVISIGSAVQVRHALPLLGHLYFESSRTFFRQTNRALLSETPRKRHLCHPPSAHRSSRFRCFIESRAGSAGHRGCPANSSYT
jgi:hypothetical protein